MSQLLWADIRRSPVSVLVKAGVIVSPAEGGFDLNNFVDTHVVKLA